MCWGQLPWEMFHGLSPCSFIWEAAKIQANTWASAQQLYAASQPQQPTSVCTLMPRDRTYICKGFHACQCVWVWVGVCGHGSGHRVLFIYRRCVPVPFTPPWVYLPPHCSLKWNPNTPVNTPARLCVSVWFQVLGTHRGRWTCFFKYNNKRFSVQSKCVSPFPPSPQSPSQYQHRF